MQKYLIAIIPLVLIAGVFFFTHSSGADEGTVEQNENNVPVTGTVKVSTTVQAGKQLSNNNCEGEGVPYKLGRSPMDPEDFTIIIPYGLVVGDHVTPIDHQYFAPKEYNSPIDAYEVYAMGNSTIVGIGERNRSEGFKEYRITFAITCTYFYYYDLVTSLSPEIKEQYDKYQASRYFGGRLKIDVREGQLIGRIGGQTLDFAVWDTEKPLQGFVKPESYESESWKIYTADPLDYYTPELKEFILSRYVRTDEPVSGNIDHDIDGRAIGNWFLEGSGGYGGYFERGGSLDYYRNHFSIAPNHIDPRGITVSFGEFNGKPRQFLVKDLHIRPEEVSVANGVVKYEVGQSYYQKLDGSIWDGNSVARDLKIIPTPEAEMNFHCVLIQMVEPRKLKMEYFANTGCDGKSFTSAAKFYER